MPRPYEGAAGRIYPARGAEGQITRSVTWHSGSGTHGLRLRLDTQHQIVPGFDERLSTLSLELPRQLAGVHAGTGETVQHVLAVPAIDG